MNNQCCEKCDDKGEPGYIACDDCFCHHPTPPQSDMKTNPAWIKGMEKRTGKSFSPQSEWEKDFEMLFYSEFNHFNQSREGRHICSSTCDRTYSLEEQEQEIKSFIKSLLASSRQDLLKEVQKIASQIPVEALGIDLATYIKRDDLLASLKKLK